MNASGDFSLVFLCAGVLATVPAAAQDELPFPTPPMGGKVGPTLQELDAGSETLGACRAANNS